MLNKPTRTVIDIPETSRLLKRLRIAHGYSVSELQRIFGFESPAAIYAWESDRSKNIPCIENFDVLARLYDLHVEDLYITRLIPYDDLIISETESIEQYRLYSFSDAEFPPAEYAPSCFIFN